MTTSTSISTAIAAAITPRTRAIIVNSPNNPTGKIYPPETLRGLADLLTAAGERNGRPIYLLSDEAYSRIIFDGRDFHSPTALLPAHLPALYLRQDAAHARPADRLHRRCRRRCPNARRSARALFIAQLVTGYAFPNALLQHALADLEPLSIDIAHLQRKRDRLVGALRDDGLRAACCPEGDLLPPAALALADDDLAFVELLAEHHIFVLPGTAVELPGLLPPLPDRQRRDDRPRAAGLRRSVQRGAVVG